MFVCMSIRYVGLVYYISNYLLLASILYMLSTALSWDYTYTVITQQIYKQKHQELAQSHTNYCYHSRKIERSSFSQFFFWERERLYSEKFCFIFTVSNIYVYIHIFLNSLLKFLHKMWATANQKYWKHKN